MRPKRAARDIRRAKPPEPNERPRRTHALAKVVLTDIQRGYEANHLIVEPAGDQKDIALQRRRDRSLRDGLLVEFCRHHGAEAADLAETRMRAQGSELLDHDLADGLSPGHEVLVAYDLEGGEPRCAGE